jgi:arylsulfatase A-like enzyme
MGFGAAVLDEKGVRGIREYAPRVIRDKRYKIHVHDGDVRELYDLAQDPGETKNLLNSDQSEHRTALRKLFRVAETLPDRDARPRYAPLPAQPWDVTIEQVRRR